MAIGPAISLLVGLIAVPVLAEDCVVIDDFAKAKVGEFPADWKVRKDAGKTVYRVQEEAGLRFLHAHAERLAVQAAKQFEWDLTAAVKYVWSERVPVGTRLESNGGLTQVRVLQSGTGQKGQWVDERVRVRDDYL